MTEHKKEHKKESRMLFVKHAAFLVSTGHKACIKKSHLQKL